MTLMLFAGIARRFTRDLRGATAIEYGLIVSLISAVMVGALVSNDLGTTVAEGYDDIATTLTQYLGEDTSEPD